MTLWHIAWNYLWNRKFTTAMTIFSVSLGVALITAVLTLREETRKRFEEEGQAIDLVVGKGNTLQMVLSSIYLLDAPTPPVPYSVYEQLKKEEDVTGAFPITLGDMAFRFRIVGCTRDLMTFDWEDPRYHPYQLLEGRYFEKPFEAVIGSEVARVTGMKLGTQFVGAHGVVEHTGTPYTVVGILQTSGTPNDRGVFTDLESTWLSHKHGAEEGDAEGEGEAEGEAEHAHAHDEKIITAVLVKLYSPTQRFEFSRKVLREYNAIPVVPVEEIRKLYDQLLNVAKTILLAIGYLVVVISSISILIGLYLSIIQRKKDLAIMRALGASRGEIFGSVLIEAFWVTLLGIGSGWLLSAVVCAGLNVFLVRQIGFAVPPMAWTPDIVTAYSAVMLMGMIAGILPAWQAYRSDIARDLAEL